MANVSCGDDGISAPHAAQIVVVPAVFHEWDRRGPPPWACPRADHDSYRVAWPLYQRTDPADPVTYVPNQAYEAGVYLKYVVDHYNDLPEAMVFVQANTDIVLKHKVVKMSLARRINSLNVTALRKANINYLPMSDVFVPSRSPAHYDRRGHADEVRQCWLRVASWFGNGHVFAAGTDPTVGFYCCNYFMVLRESIWRHPLSTWRGAYQALVVNGRCADLPVAPQELVQGDLHLAHNHKKAAPATPESEALPPDRDRGKHSAAGAFEHLAHLIWGDMHEAIYRGPKWSLQMG